MPEQFAQRYSSDLTDSEWQLIKPLFGLATTTQVRPSPRYSRRHALLGQNRLPSEGPSFAANAATRVAPWEAVYYYFRSWKKRGLFERLHDRLRRAARVKAGRRPSPSAAIVDSQSVKPRGAAAPNAASMAERRSRVESVISPSARWG